MTDYHNIDCMEGMKEFPDKYFELAIVDPPYGIGDFNISKSSSKLSKGYKIPSTEKYKPINWNDNIPDKKYFDELYRVSKNTIIFGFQNYLEFINPKHTGIIIHDFVSGGFMSHGDVAITSLQKRVTMFKYRWCGFLRENKEPTDKNRIHPCEKPVSLYKWLLSNYAKQGDKILDTHVGSGSSIIAFEKHGFDYCGFEIDKDYYEASTKRILKHRELLQQEKIAYD